MDNRTPAIEDEPLHGDPYVQLLLRHVRDPQLFSDTPERTRARHVELLIPYLEYFLRHDREGYYQALYRRKGLLDETTGAVRRDVQLHDLAKLRIHSDDLRGTGQHARLVAGVLERPGNRVFSSSGTTENPAGPVTILRSALTVQVLREAMGRQIEWMVGHSMHDSCAIIQAPPEMKATAVMVGLASECFEACGAEVLLGARLRDDPDEPNIWRRLEPNVGEIARFFQSRARGKVMLGAAASYFGMASNANVIRALNPACDADPPYLDFGEDGVLMTGGGLKRLPQFTSMRELMTSVHPSFRSRNNGDLVPVPVTDVLGLTESLSVFGNRAGDPADDETWIKVPHPLTWVGMLESPQRLQLVPDDEVGQERLLFYVSFTCLDYLEAVVSGDVVTRRHTPHNPQHGFVYERRAEESEGFQIREGCG
jgi:hypothetical protein